MKKLVAIFALLILLCSVFVFAQTADISAVVKDCLAAGNARDYCFKVCLEAGGSDAECTRLLPEPEKPSLFSRIINVFRGESAGKACCCLVGNNYYELTEENCKARQGYCADAAFCEKATEYTRPSLGKPDLSISRKCDVITPASVAPERDVSGCDDCAVTVCFNVFNQEFLCLDGYKRCVEKHLFCRPVFCEPPKIECGSCPACPPCEDQKDCCCQPYNQVMAEDVCIQRQGRCADLSACKESPDVCCKFPMPTTTTYAATPIQPQVMSEALCKEKGGTLTNMDVCKPVEKDCCCQPYNQVMAETACAQRQGRCAAVEECKTENTCCQIGSSFYEMTPDNCRSRQGSVVSYEDCETVCCQYPQSTAVTYVAQTRPPAYVLRGDCMLAGGQENPSACLPTLQTRTTPTLTTDTCMVWSCRYTPTTYATTQQSTTVACQGSKAQCEAKYGVGACVCSEGQTLSTSGQYTQPDLQADTEVCCKTGTSTYAKLPKSQCKTVVEDSFCQSLVLNPRTITGVRQISTIK